MPVGTTDDLVAGRYRMLRRLGAGGMAAVFLARDTRLERDVAIKRLHADSPEEVGRRFQREAKVGASLNHPSIVAVYDTVTDDEGVLIVMEYVAGHTLRDEIPRGPMEPGRALGILGAIASALDHAHEAGVVHRDVKPANVLIDDARGAVKLADLGIATAAERTRITRSGNVLGTASYMAPERLDGGAGGPPVDVYALAAMAFELLSGRKAVEGSTPLEIARRVATAPPPDLRDAVPDAPEAAADALKRGLAKDPDERPRSAGELVRELSAAYAAQAERDARPPTAPVRSEPAPARSATPPPTGPVRPHRARSRWLGPGALAAAAILALALLAIALASGGGGDKPSSDNPASSAPKQQQSGGSQQTQPQQGGGQSQPSGGSGTPAPAPSAGGSSGGGTDASTPTGAVSAFYTTAANKDYKASWALGTDNLHRQLGSYASYVGQERTLTAIEFPKLTVTDQSGSQATVAFRSVAHHTNRTDRCSGTVTVVKGGSGWLVDQLHVAGCNSSPA